jgi:serine phosphatase RsbU (regulator of sigma subunit)
MRLGLRLKSGLALLGCILLVLVLSVVVGWRALKSVEENLGTAFVRNSTQYDKQRILSPVLRELALGERLAESELTKSWLRDEGNAGKKTLFFAEAEHYRKAFADKSYFVISNATLHYYFNDARSKYSTKPRYSIKRNVPHDAWFFATMRQKAAFNINVDPDVKLGLTKVWFNIVVSDGSKRLGLAGTGLDLTSFLTQFMARTEAGVTPMILNRQGAIQAHPNRALIDYSSVNDKGKKHSTLFRLLPLAADQAQARAAMERAEREPDAIQLFRGTMDGHTDLFAVSFIPELGWHIVTAADLQAVSVLDRKLWMLPLTGGVALLGLLLLFLMVAVNRIVLSPLLKLTGSARAIGAGNYQVELPPAGHDELGDLSRAFGTMATQIQSHTIELEDKVRERTSELLAVNDKMAAASKQISDSIQAASLIQSAILPAHEMEQSLPSKYLCDYFVMWKPRDVVGGDFYVFRQEEAISNDAGGCLIGVVDCAGHGVPGAVMTAIAHSALSAAMDTQGLRDPAALLMRLDSQIRALLQGDPSLSHVATNMDAGLAFVDFAARTVTYSGSKLALFWCDAGRSEIGELKGARRAIGGKRIPVCANETVPLVVGRTFYLLTDGLLDQSGGPKGYSFGQERLAQMLGRNASSPLKQQAHAIESELAAYQGTLAQRDDITVVGFGLQ